MRLAVALLALVTVAPPLRAAHQPGLSVDEEKCQQAVGKQLNAFGAKRIKCLVQCDRAAAKGDVPAADCLPPYAGDTRACLDTARAKAAAAMTKPCARDCPECYGGPCVAANGDLLDGLALLLDDFVPLVACDDSASGDGLTPAEAKARQQVATALGKLGQTFGVCLAKCRKAEASGKIPPFGCDGTFADDPKTAACIGKAATKAAGVVVDPDLDAPECLDPLLPVVASGIAEAVNLFDPFVYCASPSGAFLTP